MFRGYISAMERGNVPGTPRKGCLSELATGLAAGSAGPGELFEAFLSATVFCERPGEPGFVAVGEPGEAMIAVFSSLEELAAHAAGRPDYRQAGVDWFSTTGEDLLGLLPDGYDLVLDPASEHALRLRAAAWRRRPAIAVSRNASHPRSAEEPR